MLTQTLREEIQQADGDDDEYHQGAGLLELETADRLPQGDADAACADHADDGGGTDVRFEAVERIGDQQRHDLGQHAVKDLFNFVGAGGANTFDRAGFNGFHGFGKQLGEQASIRRRIG